MKIVFTGGGTGGHFYPIIAVVEKVNMVIDREKILGAKLETAYRDLEYNVNVKLALDNLFL